jgi:hypothetical protein
MRAAVQAEHIPQEVQLYLMAIINRLDLALFFWVDIKGIFLMNLRLKLNLF